MFKTKQFFLLKKYIHVEYDRDDVVCNSVSEASVHPITKISQYEGAVVPDI